LRLALGIAGAAAFAALGYAATNAGALLLVLSNFIDHTDGELAHRAGHRVGWPGYRCLRRF
jgi:archaetidylinositol phosphate synthase